MFIIKIKICTDVIILNLYYVSNETIWFEHIETAICNSSFSYEAFSDIDTLCGMVSGRQGIILYGLKSEGALNLEDISNLKSRTKTKDIPVVVLTDDSHQLSKIKAYYMGIDDYISLPFSPLEFLSRISAVSMRAEKSTEEILSFSDIKMDMSRHSVHVGSREISLTLKEYEILFIMLKNKGLLIKKDELFKEIWKNTAPEKSRTLDIHMKTLRHKLGSSGDLLKTVRGVGYKL